MFAGGYLGKFLRVDLTRKQYRQEELSFDLLTKYLGGRGIAVYFYYKELTGKQSLFRLKISFFSLRGP